MCMLPALLHRAGTEKYVDRGIIPRTISMLFNEFSRRSDYTFQVSHGSAVSHGGTYPRRGRVSIIGR